MQDLPAPMLGFRNSSPTDNHRYALEDLRAIYNDMISRLSIRGAYQH